MSLYTEEGEIITTVVGDDIQDEVSEYLCSDGFTFDVSS